MTCDHCQAEVPYDIVTCPSCGYPQNGTVEEKTYYLNNYRPKDPAYVAMKRFRAARVALYVYGVLGAAGSILIVAIAGSDPWVGMTTEVIIVLVLALALSGLFILFGAMARTRPKPIFVIAAVLMVLLAALGQLGSFSPLRLLIEIALFVPVARAIPRMDDLQPQQVEEPGILDSTIENDK
jgi:hypothetical protein